MAGPGTRTPGAAGTTQGSRWRFSLGAPAPMPVSPPAAGANWVCQLPPDRLAMIEAVRFTLTTDVTVANRLLVVEMVGQSGTIFATSPASAAVAATGTATLSLWPNAPTYSASTGFTTLALPMIMLPPGSKIQSAVVTLKAGDKLSNITVLATLY